MFQKRLKDDDGSVREVNMTPLIDVSLVLVTMLMLASPMTFESSISVQESQAGTVEQPRVEDHPIELHIVSEDSVDVNETRYARPELRAHLRAMVDATVPPRVIVACEGEVSHGAFVNVLDQVRMSGVGDIAVVGR